ncbi:MAG: hypothetical protein M0031_09380 [Thermaerobacter sp.]|nr:hypothetical protein [Thermaerobacter sp.]
MNTGSGGGGVGTDFVHSSYTYLAHPVIWVVAFVVLFVVIRHFIHGAHSQIIVTIIFGILVLLAVIDPGLICYVAQGVANGLNGALGAPASAITCG